MLYYNLETKKYPVSFYELQLEYPNMSFSEDTVPSPYVKVNDTPVPEFNKLTQKLTRELPVLSNGIWYEKWVVTNLDEETIKSNLLHEKNYVLGIRKQLLQLSDWTQLPDSKLENKIQWAEYRQKLRDITNQTEFPLNIKWPEPPVKNL